MNKNLSVRFDYNLTNYQNTQINTLDTISLTAKNTRIAMQQQLAEISFIVI